MRRGVNRIRYFRFYRARLCLYRENECECLCSIYELMRISISVVRVNGD